MYDNPLLNLKFLLTYSTLLPYFKFPNPFLYSFKNTAVNPLTTKALETLHFRFVKICKCIESQSRYWHPDRRNDVIVLQEYAFA